MHVKTTRVCSFTFFDPRIRSCIDGGYGEAMFTGKSRPVPSKDALKVLYQLAYISGGTAVGVATLCAEERRRRTQVVQKIADNARRIRQSPRYYQNAAVAHQEPSEDVLGPEGGFEWVQQDGEQSGKRRRKAFTPLDQTPRAAELPSVVEKGYAQVEKQHPIRAEAGGRRMRNAQAHAGITSEWKTLESMAPVGTSGSRGNLAVHHKTRLLPRQHVATQSKPMIMPSQRQHGTTERHPVHPRNLTVDSSSVPENHEYIHQAFPDLAEQKVQNEFALLPSSVQEQYKQVMRHRKSRHAICPFDMKTAVSACLNECPDKELVIIPTKLLRWARANMPPDDFHETCASFLSLCERQGSYKLVREIFGRHRIRQIVNMGDMSAQCLETIAFACVQTRGRGNPDLAYLTTIYRRLPLDRRSRLAQSWASLPLLASWRSTHDLDQVLKKAHTMQLEVKAAGDIHGSRLIDSALLGILLSANAHAEALELLTRMHKETPSDVLAVTIAAVSFAKKGEWTSLEQALSIAKRSATFAIDVDATRRLNNVVNLYTKAHTATESWKFVTSLVDDIGFRPNQATSEIMLQCFIASGCIGLMSNWLRYARIAGFKFTLDARVAGNVLGRFYLQYRPSHILMLWFTRNIAHGAPALSGPELMDPVKEALAYDARNVSGQHAAKLRQSLTEEMRKLEGSSISPESTDNMASTPAADSANCLEPTPGADHAQDPPDTTSEDVLNAWDIELPITRQEAQPDDTVASNAIQPTERPLATPDATGHDELAEMFGASNDVERDMLLALSWGRHSRVISLYHAAKDGGGLPASPFSLEVAVQACLKLENGGTTLASDILREAKQNGMNITCAMGPMLSNQMKQMSKISTWKDMGGLKKSVIEYYQVNDKNGWPVKHHVGVTATNLLLRAGMPYQAIEVVDTIFESEWARKQPPSIVVMTAALRAYTAVRSDKGIHTIFHTVLKKNVHIDQRFLRVAKQTLKEYRSKIGPAVANPKDWAVRDHLIGWIRECQERRLQQMFEAKITGKKLVACLIKLSNEAGKPTIPLDKRKDIEDSIFGATLDDTISGQDPIDPSMSCWRRDQLQARKVAIAKAIRAEDALDRDLPRAEALRRGGLQRSRQYRAYLRHDLVGPGNKVASFRYS